MLGVVLGAGDEPEACAWRAAVVAGVVDADMGECVAPFEREEVPPTGVTDPGYNGGSLVVTGFILLRAASPTRLGMSAVASRDVVTTATLAFRFNFTVTLH